MSESAQKSTVLVITDNIELLSSLLESNTTDFEFISRESLQMALDDPELLANNDIVILDIDSVNGGTQAVIEQSIKLKKSDPTQVLMMVGDAEPLGEILRSNIQPMVYRAFNKPISPNQIFLAFGSASKLHASLVQKQAAGEDLLAIGPLENRTNIDTISEKKNKSLIYAAVGALALAVVGWLLFANNGSDSDNLAETRIVTPVPNTDQPNIINTNDDVATINSLNQEAAIALLEGRQVTPENDNALSYYDQVLAIDPYDLTAYEGKKALATDLKNTYTMLVDAADFDKALDTVSALQAMEPLDSSNYELQQDLETEINSYLAELKKDGSPAEISRMAAMMARIGPKLKSSQSAAAALQKEQELVTAIDAALEKNNLVPPQPGNAYALVSEALQKNLISNANFAPRLSALSEKLVQSAKEALAQDNLEEAEKLTALIKRLDVAPQNIALLDAAIEEKKAAIAAEEAEEIAAENPSDEAVEEEPLVEEIAEPEAVKIIPAKIIARSAPRYPSRALERDIEGWVSIGFIIDTDGVPKDITVIESEPGTTFDSAAIKSVEKWRFSPARNEQTNEAVETTVESTKLQFKIGQ